MNEPNAGKVTQEDGAKLYRQPKLEARIKEKQKHKANNKAN